MTARERSEGLHGEVTGLRNGNLFIAAQELFFILTVELHLGPALVASSHLVLQQEIVDT